MGRTAVVAVAGLTRALLARLPRLGRWAAGRQTAAIEPLLPAVTCSAQATYLTGRPPSEHGIVANGWYCAEECEIKFWHQCSRLVQAPRLWDIARYSDPDFTCANLFWCHNMYATVDVSITPRPMCPADGRKIPDIYTQPAGLRDQLQAELGRFPLSDFWGPRASIRASVWIAAAAQRVDALFLPSLSLVYLPHLDYCLQRRGPHGTIERDLADIDTLAAELIEFYEGRGVRVVLLSEYGVAPASRAVPLNWHLRDEGYVAVREELGRELLDAGASRAFAVADHQLAHVYVRDPADLRAVRSLLEAVPGVDRAYARQELPHLNHPRSGDLIAVAERDAWFSYYYWHDERKAPDFARTVDGQRKPGYDPAELMFDPAIPFPALKIAWRRLQQRLGLRTVFDLVPVHGDLVRGSHGRTDAPAAELPVIVGEDLARREAAIPATAVLDVLLDQVFGGYRAPGRQARRAA